MNKTKVLIRWLDAKSTACNWEELGDVNFSLLTIETCGWLVFENKEVVGIAESIIPSQNHLTQVICIPKACITSRRVLR